MASEILPETDDTDSAGFWAAAREGKLVVQRCEACGKHRFPPHPYCPACRSSKMSWAKTSGRGKVWTFAVAYKPMVPAFAPFTPYPVIYVELDDHKGLRMAGTLVARPGAAINSVDPQSIRIGMPVRVVFDKLSDDVTLPRWIPEA